GSALWRQNDVSLSGQTMVSFEETSGQHFQSVRDIASFGKGCFAAFGARFVLAVLERTRGIKSVIMISASAAGAVGSARSEVLTFVLISRLSLVGDGLPP
ncbi:MAG TPA: hypothetical protein VFA77_09800, partial [Candidatus Eisenbacteria bacterium]|nr:hypothetical protein [Candidatus Eisenbacteria bacterium]